MAFECYQFRDTGRCRFGDACKFSHDIEHSNLMVTQQDEWRDERDVLYSFNDMYQSGCIAEFFYMDYPGFDYDAENDAVEEWRRLCIEYLHVDPDDNEEYLVRDSRRNLRTAMVRQFNERFGEDDDDLLAWQTLCFKVDIGVPDDIAECKRALTRTHVNLVDLTQMKKDDPPPTKFRTVKELSVYSKSTGKIFPRDHIEAGSLLKTLLRQINNPPPSYDTYNA